MQPISARISSGLFVLALAIVAGSLIAFGLELYEPYLAATRPWAHGLVFCGSGLVIAGLLWRLRRRGFDLASGALLLLWCVPALALLYADARFSRDKHAVLAADGEAASQIGRHLMIGYTKSADIAPLAARGLIGGIYVTHHNIAGRTAADLKAEIAGLQALRAKAGLPPLIVAADQEGGIVSHLSPQLTALPALATFAPLPPEQRAAGARALGETQGRELHDLGITLNFSPVVDLRMQSHQRHPDINSLISRRAISDDPSVVTAVAQSYIEGLAAAHVAATVKHFPGLGRADADTHLYTARINAPVNELEAVDWQPFRELLKRTPASLMVGHAMVTAVDPGRPASLSRRVISGLVRGAWGYDGLIVTDDMVMGAVYRAGICQSAVSALNAGVDMVLIAYDGAQYYRAFPCMLAALAKGKIDMAALHASEARLDRGLLPMAGPAGVVSAAPKTSTTE
jgi:beta-N-acetylhexosaminidase